MVEKVTVQHDHVQHQIDDEDESNSESSNHDTDTSSYSKMNDCKDTSYTDANKELLQEMKGADRSVLCWRVIVRILMISIAILLTSLTYVKLSESETKDFEASFQLYSDELLLFASYELQVLAESLEAMSDSITSQGLRTGSNASTGELTWPYVTLPPTVFNEHAAHVTSFSGNKLIYTAHVVHDVVTWNEFNTAVFNTSGLPFNPYMFTYDADGTQSVNGTGPFIPIHEIYTESSLLLNSSISINNVDTLSEPGLAKSYTLVASELHSVMTELLPLKYIREYYPDVVDASEPLSMLIEPVFDNFQEKAKIVGYVNSLFQWSFFFSHLKTSGKDIVAVVENTCGDQFAFIVSSDAATYINYEDALSIVLEDVKAVSAIGTDDIPLDDIEKVGATGICIYSLTVYPTIEFRQAFNHNAALYTVVIGITMLCMVGAFFAYDGYVKHRNNKVMRTAIRATAIVTSMFPSNVRDRLYEDMEQNEKEREDHRNLKTYLRDSDGSNLDVTNTRSTPLADLFPETTLLFADIAGFTAWSSVREPCQVFILLETLYSAFDAIAKRRRIFKVETIGDCYVAAAGLPVPRAEHAIVMSKFADDIRNTMRTLTRELETTLGPDTGDLSLRIGLHSGPVTAGVLRGERARFQLFGDTMNTAARMEQTGMKNMIQVSQATADALVAGGKGHWIRPRDEKVVAKGKGEMSTFWLEMKSSTRGTTSSRSSGSGHESKNSVTESNSDREHTGNRQSLRKKSKNLLVDKIDRLVDWNTDNLLRLLLQILNCRQGSSGEDNTDKNGGHDEYTDVSFTVRAKPFDEVKEIISLPQVRKSKIISEKLVSHISDEVSHQLRDYVSKIANMYNNNHFHNFEHASHVTMSVTKLLSRIVAPSDLLDDYRDRPKQELLSTLHDHTYGITSDPLTQFACVFSALIHDVDHPGVPNSQILNENAELACRYDGKSIAEQNSIDLAWQLLMKDEFTDLRNAICATSSEFVRFRQLVVNAVMATDIMDKDLKMIRDARWTKAFIIDPTEKVETTVSQREMLDEINRKATVVIEHMIQASDVSHTMQHWHIYRKWNELFYLECYDSYEKGRCKVDPTDSWYQGELDFYDYYIIPLANKLAECGVFGVSSTEYLQYARSNRSEWQARGKEIVSEMRVRALAMKGKDAEVCNES